MLLIYYRIWLLAVLNVLLLSNIIIGVVDDMWLEFCILLFN